MAWAARPLHRSARRHRREAGETGHRAPQLQGVRGLPWATMLRTNANPVAVSVLDRCRIRRASSSTSQARRPRTVPIVGLERQRVAAGPDLEEIVRWSMNGRSLLHDLAPGDRVSLHGNGCVTSSPTSSVPVWSCWRHANMAPVRSARIEPAELSRSDWGANYDQPERLCGCSWPVGGMCEVWCCSVRLIFFAVCFSFSVLPCFLSLASEEIAGHGHSSSATARGLAADTVVAGVRADPQVTVRAIPALNRDDHDASGGTYRPDEPRIASSVRGGSARSCRMLPAAGRSVMASPRHLVVEPPSPRAVLRRSADE